MSHYLRGVINDSTVTDRRMRPFGLRVGYEQSDLSGEGGIIRESKESCPVKSDSSGGVGIVRGKLRGIFEQAESFSIRVRAGWPT